ncbi:hypothetical protein U1Q18_034237 [Sarracenia purpurea var. burkii]
MHISSFQSVTSVEALGTHVLAVCAAPNYCPGQISSFFRDSRDSSARLVGQKKIYRGAGFRSVCLRRDRRSHASRSSPSLGECFGMVPIYVDNEFGEGISPFLSDAFQDINARIPYRSVIPPFASHDRIVAELYKLMRMQTRVFVVHMFPTLASQVFAKAKEVGMMSEGYVWIITDAVANALGLLDPSAIDSMQGVLGVEPYVPTTKQLANFTNRWKTKFQ